MSRVRILDDVTINQIAAGEVIESPASVIKELVENSIDAEADSIAVETKAGGRTLISVRDNGCGMGRDDLFLCLERHATSKIRTLDDLSTLLTLGFRGEAIPSIASISKMAIHTAARSGGEPTLLRLEGGKIIDWKPAPRGAGTTIEVKSLFYNVPVRKKFQKSINWETAEIRSRLTWEALAHPEVRFEWTHEDKVEFALPKAEDDLGYRLEALLGKEFHDALLPVHFEEGSCHLTGFIGKASSHRPNRKGQYLFINRRPVFSPLISAVIAQGYATRLPEHRFPAFVLYLTLPPEWVDVNVHPQKKEVRLREPEIIRRLILGAVEQALERRHLPAAISVPFLPEAEPVSYCQPILYKESPPRLLEEPAFVFRSSPAAKVRALLGRYLLVECYGLAKEGLAIVDARAAAARILYEEMVKKMECGAPPPSQALLLPMTLELSPQEAPLVIERLELLNKMGIGIRFFGSSTFMVDAIPPSLEMHEVAEFIKGLGEAPPGEGQMIKRLCQSARKKITSHEEAEALVARLLDCDTPHLCPQGRPTYTVLSEEELEKRFTRGQ